MSPADEREAAHLEALATALGITVGELVFRSRCDIRQRERTYDELMRARYWPAAVHKRCGLPRGQAGGRRAPAA